MKILVADDEKAVRDSLRRSLIFNGYEVSLAEDGAAALAGATKEEPDLLLIDIMMPKMDGLEVCRRLRSSGYSRPIMVLTARDQVSDRVAGLDAGADDYLPKPFALEELLARVRSLLRRYAVEKTHDVNQSELTFGDLRMDLSTREVFRGQHPIALTRTEFTLLELFLNNPRKVLTRQSILEDVWGYDFPTSGNALEVYIGYLRRKTEAHGEDRLIQTVRSVGYVLKEKEA